MEVPIKILYGFLKKPKGVFASISIYFRRTTNSLIIMQHYRELLNAKRLFLAGKKVTFEPHTKSEKLGMLRGRLSSNQTSTLCFPFRLQKNTQIFRQFMKKNFHWQFNEQQFRNKKDSNDKQEVISYE